MLIASFKIRIHPSHAIELKQKDYIFKGIVIFMRFFRPLDVNLPTMKFCPPNVSLSDFWLNHGISHCFMDTVSSSVITGFLLIFGSIQLIMYKKYATPIEADRIAASSLYNFQIFLHTFVPALALVRFMLQATVYHDAIIYGYMVRRNICFH